MYVGKMIYSYLWKYCTYCIWSAYTSRAVLRVLYPVLRRNHSLWNSQGLTGLVSKSRSACMNYSLPNPGMSVFGESSSHLPPAFPQNPLAPPTHGLYYTSSDLLILLKQARVSEISGRAIRTTY